MPFRPIQWARRSIEGRQIEADGSRLLNFYPITLSAPEESKVPVMLYSSPGQRRFLRVPNRPVSSGVTASDGIHDLLEIDSVLYGHWLFGLSAQYQFFALQIGSGNIGSGYDPFGDPASAIFQVPFNNLHEFTDEAQEAIPADEPSKLVTDGRRVLWVSPSEVYMFDLAKAGGPGFEAVSAPVPDDPTTNQDLSNENWVDCAWSDGFFILAAESGQFFHSLLHSSQFEQLDFARADTSADSLVAVEVLNSRLYLLGANTIEQWYNAGGGDFAFARDRSFTANIGCISRATVANNLFAILFLGSDRIVYQITAGTFGRISTEAVEFDIGRSLATEARGYTYTEEGHRFYSLTLLFADGSRKNWTYDFNIAAWHERTQTDILCSLHFSSHQVLIGKEGASHVFDQRLDWGGIESDDAAQDDVPIVREAVSPIIFANLQRVIQSSFQIDVPLRPGDPEDSLLIEWSDDAKQTWQGGTAIDGTTPKTKLLNDGPRHRVNRMGQIRTGRHIRIRTEAKRRVDVLGAYVETDVLPD